MDLTDNVIQEVQQKEGLIASFLDTLPEKALNLGIRIGLALIFFFIGVQLIKLIRKIIRKSMSRAGAETGVIQFVDSFVKASLYIILILTLASSFGVDAASIVALLGSAGVAVGLAVQGSLSNLAGGVLILLLKPFKVGDYIVEGSSGKEGTVKEIQIFYTKLLTYDNQTIILPNGNLANNTIVNVTAAESRRCDVKVSVAYSAEMNWQTPESIYVYAAGSKMRISGRENGVLPNSVSMHLIKQKLKYRSLRWMCICVN